MKSANAHEKRTPSEDGTLLLAIDDSAFPVREDLCLHIAKPEARIEPLVTPSPYGSAFPDNKGAFFYGTVIEDDGPFGGKFRMWYHGCHWPPNPDWPDAMKRQYAKHDIGEAMLGPVCYAESEDGVEWFKPELEQETFYGTNKNNAIALPYAVTLHVCVIKDDDDPDPARRYKMAYQACPKFSAEPMEELGPVSTAALAVSPDGIHWNHHPTPYPGAFMEISSFYKFDGKYVINAHTMAAGGQGTYRTEGGGNTGRIGLARFSHDFDHWTPGFVDSFQLPQPRDPERREPKGEYPQVHLGVGAVDVGGVCVGLYGRWTSAINIHDAICDFGLVVSNDGLVFREPYKGHVFLDSLDSRDSPAKAHPARQFHTNMCQGNGILNVGDETRIYHGRWRNTGFFHLDKYHGEVALATIPRDRWGSYRVYPNFPGGTIWTKALRLTNPDFTINAAGAEGIKIELADERFNLIPEFSGDNVGTLVGDDGFELRVKWANSPKTIVDESIRMKFTLSRDEGSDPKLFAVNL